MLYGIPHRHPTDGRPQLAVNYYNVSRVVLDAQVMTRTVYHPRINGQTERYSKTIVDRLRHYVREQQNDWVDYVHRLAYAYNDQVHTSTCTTHFSPTLSCEPQGSADIIQPIVADDADDNLPR